MPGTRGRSLSPKKGAKRRRVRKRTGQGCMVLISILIILTITLIL